jgi:hypothetical protein
MRRRSGRGRPSPAGPSAATGDRGMVTAELALALPALVAVLGVVLAVIAIGLAQVRCVDAAAVAARLAARGEPDRVVRGLALSAAPRGAHLQVASDGRVVTASVSAAIRLPGIGRLLPAYVVRGSVAQEREAAVAEVRSG